MSLTYPVPVLDLSRAEQRALIASTPPASRWLHSHVIEDFAIFKLTRDECLLEVDRIDNPARSTSDITDTHLGAIRLFDRGLLTLHSYTDTHVTWRLRDVDAESDALRMLRRRTLGFLPYNMGYRKLTPDTMTGPELVALLVWHYRHTTVRRLDIRVSGTGIHVGLLSEVHADDTIRDQQFPLLTHVDDFEAHTRTIHPHREPHRYHAFDERVLHTILTNLATRVAPSLFNEQGLRVDLNTWRLTGYRQGPDSYTQTLPLNVQDALAMLEAPDFADADDFVAWAEKSLLMTTLCRFGTDPVLQRNGRRHTFRMDPHTHEPQTVPSENVEQDTALETVHFLASLSEGPPPPRCREVIQAWRNTLGEIANTLYEWESAPETEEWFAVAHEYRSRWTEKQADRILAIHWVSRMVQYLDAGLTSEQVTPVFGFDVPTVKKLLASRGGFSDEVGTADGAVFTAEVRRARERARKGAVPVTASF